MKKDLNKLRDDIDKIDTKLLDLISKRASIAQEVGKIKNDGVIYRPEREAQVLLRLLKVNKGPLSNESITNIFKSVISNCRALEKKLSVSFLGPLGTFSEEATIRQFGENIETIPTDSIDQVFNHVQSGIAHYGVVPVENSTEGAISRTLDLLLTKDLKICGEIILPVHHFFLSKNNKLKGIKTIYAHGQSLAQCHDWLMNNAPDIKKVSVRDDEIGKLTVSIDEMTKELQQRTNRAETFSNDLAHEIRNPLASLKSASELLDKTTEKDDSEKLLKIINHDVERIERLITDYSQMLKDEASLSREKMSKINLIEIINSVAEDFKQDLINQNKKIKIKVVDKIDTKNGCYIFGISNRLEQVIANLLDNSISFSQNNQTIEIGLEETSNNVIMTVRDEGPGFSETSPQKIFKRFYSNRPKNFGKHSGLGLNIVKNIVELHKGTIVASNRINTKGAQVEVLLPKYS